MVDGTFKCYQHELGFDDLDEFRDHISNESHNHKGVSPCNICGISTTYNYTGKLAKGK